MKKVKVTIDIPAVWTLNIYSGQIGEGTPHGYAYPTAAEAKRNRTDKNGGVASDFVGAFKVRISRPKRRRKSVR